MSVSAGNAERTDYTGATIKYLKANAGIVDTLEKLLKKEYADITKVLLASGAAEITVTIGKK